jgi:hypothetical protein
MAKISRTKGLLEELRSPDEIVWRKAAQLLFSRNDAVSELLKAISETRYSEDHWSAFALGLIDKGVQENNRMLILDAERIFRELLRANRESPMIMNNLGVVLSRLGKNKEAKSLFRRAFVRDFKKVWFRAFLWPAWKNYFEMMASIVFASVLLAFAFVPAVLIWFFTGPLLMQPFAAHLVSQYVGRETLVTILSALVQVNGFFIGFVAILAVFILQQVRGDYRRWLMVIGVSSLIWWFFVSILDSVWWMTVSSNTSMLPATSIVRPLENTTWGAIGLVLVILVTTRAPQAPAAPA